ncbi:phosphoribosylglycinamide formyltransferase [Nitritalea halalkaliphila LW7]|uniref:Phosphoribosylglycinamide formyltransferase n=1 Tax=Nitritalea halalkaliphila LW7 TaxID=1189621 RepID=I5BZY5_9BACT|nr:phosphoribosylglycinamide formyltransferase [Nitritalea halalkaliphila]EIM75137.1 phosphoribosylglycinamide formyltransferase [Nitritalea halalkaliphila LW7]
MLVKKIAILASGSGSNAENIARYFKGHPTIQVALIASNKADAYVLKRAEQLSIEGLAFSKSDLQSGKLLEELQKRAIDWVILAGFLLQIPPHLIAAFPERMLNIHPALLPAYGGKGMYGHHVHAAVKAAGESHTGITIHLVNAAYDEGKILFQAGVALSPEDSVETIAEKVHALEYRFFPEVIERQLLGTTASDET